MCGANPLVLAISAVVEQLERRQLLDAMIVGRVLVVTGDGNANAITLAAPANQVTVNIDGTPFAFNTANFDTISVDALGGGDTVTMPGNLPASVTGVTIVGGTGGDTIHGSNLNDTVDAGTGNDSIDGGDGEDTIQGNDGNDTINGENGDDRIFPGLGDDSITGGAGADTATYEERSEALTIRIDG